MKKGNNINLKLPLTKNIKRTHDVHVLNMSFENMESVFGQAINQHGICVHMIHHYGTIFDKISNSQILQLQVLRSSRSLIILCIKHNSIVITKNFSGLAMESTMWSPITKFLNVKKMHQKSKKKIRHTKTVPTNLIKWQHNVDIQRRLP